MRVVCMDSIPVGSNPFNHDLYNMGTPIAKNVLIMHHTHNDEVARYIIIVNTATGERMEVVFEENKKEGE